MNHQIIFEYLIQRDRKLKKILIYDDKCPFFQPKEKIKKNTHLQNLCREIIGQQLSVKAANSIWKKLTININSNKQFIHKIESINMDDHKKYGLSRNKLLFIKNLLHKTKNKELNFSLLNKLSNEEVIDILIQFKGIGNWTAEMFLIFSLNRIDIFSINDLGLKNAIKKLYKLEDISEGKLLKLANKWKPYRSVVSWYLWRYLDNN